jgi:hypothetical protein
MRFSGLAASSASGVFLAGSLGDREHRYRRNAELNRLSHRLDQQIDTQPLDAGHRGDRLPLVLPFMHKQRPNQVVDRKAAFRHQPPGPIVPA